MSRSGWVRIGPEGAPMVAAVLMALDAMLAAGQRGVERAGLVRMLQVVAPEPPPAAAQRPVWPLSQPAG